MECLSARRMEKGAMWIDEPHELASIFYYLYKGQSTLIEIIRSLRRKKAYRFFNIKDPLPFFFFVIWSFKKLIKLIFACFKRVLTAL